MNDDDAAQARFRDVFETSYPRLVGYALRRASSPEDAADAVAQTYLIAWRRLDDLPEGGEAMLWLYGTIRKVMANQHRAEHRRSQLSERLGAELAALPVTDVATGIGELSALASVFGALSAEQRDILGLVAWEGLDTRALASVLGCSTTNAKVRLHRARRQFAAGLAKADLRPEPPPGRGVRHQPDADRQRSSACAERREVL